MPSRPPHIKVVRSLALVSSWSGFDGAPRRAASAPNPYKCNESWNPQLPDGRDGNPLGCEGKTFGPIVKIAPSRKVLATFGGGLFVQPHGLYVDRDGVIWQLVEGRFAAPRGSTADELEEGDATGLARSQGRRSESRKPESLLS